MHRYCALLLQGLALVVWLAFVPEAAYRTLTDRLPPEAPVGATRANKALILDRQAEAMVRAMSRLNTTAICTGGLVLALLVGRILRRDSQ